MSFIGDFIGDTVGGITGAKQAAQGAEKAGQQQYQAAMAGVDEQRRQFDKLVQILSPYVNAGVGAMGGQQALLGLSGPQAQQSAISALENSPMMQSMIQQGENSMLQNAAATGGLRGGNLQSAMANFRPQLLTQMIQNQYANLGGLSQLGQASAATQAAQGMVSGQNIANLLGQGGAAQAGATMGRAGVPRQAFGDAIGFGKMLSGF